MGTKYSSQASSGYNASPPVDDGTASEANKVKWSTIKTKLSDVLKTFIEAVNTALVTALDQSCRTVSASDSAAATDHNRTIQVTSSSVVITLADAATMAAGYIVSVANQSSGDISVALATATNTIDTVTNATQTISAKEVRRYIVNTDATGYITASAGFRDHPFPRMWVSGLVISQAADTDHDITVSTGECRDSTNAQNMVLASAITKRIDASWAVGSAQGGLDGTESSAGTPDVSTWYYIWLIKRSDTGVVDALYSESSSAPTMPAGYDYKRLIGAVHTDSSANIEAFTAIEMAGGGLDVLWTTPTLDVDLSNTLTTARRVDVIKVPTAFRVDARVHAYINDASANGSFWICSPDMTDAAPSTTAAPLGTGQSTTTFAWYGSLDIRTNTSGQIAARATVATVDTYRVVTLGWKWGRR